jgi:hypothetical protein
VTISAVAAYLGTMSRAVCFLVVLAAAIALASSTGASTGGSRDRALLRTVLAGMKTDLVSVQIRALPPEWRFRARYGKRLLHVASTATTPAAKVLDEWYATLIATGYDDQCRWKADHCLAVYELTGRGGGAIGGSGAQRPFASRPTLSRLLHTRFTRARLHVSSISFEHPYAFAPIVTVTSRHPQRAVSAYQRAGALFSRLHIAGSFVRMLDGRGRLFLASGGSGKDAEGWVRPGLRLHNVP